MKKIPLQLAALLAQSQVTGLTFPTFLLPGPQRPRVGFWSFGLLGFPDATADLLVSEIFFSPGRGLEPPSPFPFRCVMMQSHQGNLVGG